MFGNLSWTAASLMGSHTGPCWVISSSVLVAQMVNLMLINHFKDPLGEIFWLLLREATVVSPSDVCRSDTQTLRPQRTVLMAHPRNCTHKQTNPKVSAVRHLSFLGLGALGKGEITCLFMKM